MRRLWTKAAVGTAVAAGAVAAYRTIVQPWQERWGATDEEVRARLPGDELVGEPASQTTRAITIDAAPEDVWPWVVQIGADRGGFYSYDWLENLFGLGIHSSDRVQPDWQERALGDLVYGNRSGTGGWYVMEVRPKEALVLKMGDVKQGRPVRRDENLKWEFLWTFALKEGPNGTTRFIVRERAGFDSKVTQLLMSPIGMVSFVMTQKTLRGVKARAEAAVRHDRSAAPGPRD